MTIAVLMLLILVQKGLFAFVNDLFSPACRGWFIVLPSLCGCVGIRLGICSDERAVSDIRVRY